MNIMESILQQMPGISQPPKKFLITLFSTILLAYGKSNFTNLSRYSYLSGKTYRRHFLKSFNSPQFNQYFLKEALNPEHTIIAVIDCSFLRKSCKKTDGKAYFYNGVAGKSEQGYLYKVEQKKLGSPRKYDGKFDSNDLSRLKLVKNLKPGVSLYILEVGRCCLNCQISLACISEGQANGKIKNALLFSTDIHLPPEQIVEYYQARFQIEFIFSDAKQFTGLSDCQARHFPRLDFHFNASIIALGVKNK
jgi:hypothetical protein